MSPSENATGDKNTNKRVVKRRRVVVPPPEGTDTSPEPESGRFPPGDNEERLKDDVPPHWG